MPPPDESGGFQSLKDLKIKDASAPQISHGPNRTPRPERKGVTEESKTDLRKALAEIAGIKSSNPPKPETSRLHERSSQGQGRVQAKPEGEGKVEAKEVPEDVLKRLLDVGN